MAMNSSRDARPNVSAGATVRGPNVDEAQPL